MASLNFKHGIRKFMTDTDVKFTLSNNAMNLTDRLLNGLNSKLVQSCSNISEMTVETARSVVAELFPESLKRCAIAQGNRLMVLFNSGLLDYNPGETVIRRKIKGKKALAVAAIKFTRGISNLKSVIHPLAVLHDDAKKFFCEMLENMAVKISDRVQAKSKDSITQQDIRTAISNIFPQGLLAHALTEASRITVLFETSMLQEAMDTEPPTEPRPKTEAKSMSTQRGRKRKRSTSKKASTVSKRRRKARKPVKKREAKPMTTKTGRKRKRSTSKKASTVSKRRRKASKPVKKRETRPMTAKRERKRKSSAQEKVSTVSKRRRKASKAVKKRETRPMTTKRERKRKGSAQEKASTVSKRRRKARQPVKKLPRKSKRKETVARSPGKLSKKKPTKQKLSSREGSTYKCSPIVTTEIDRLTKKLNLRFRQKLSPQSQKLFVHTLSDMLGDLIGAMVKYSVIGLKEVKTAVEKVLPKNMAGVANANMSRAIMS